eukprot:2394471-Lingulodinium_polyedra.AAC.1
MEPCLPLASELLARVPALLGALGSPPPAGGAGAAGAVVAAAEARGVRRAGSSRLTVSAVAQDLQGLEARFDGLESVLHELRDGLRGMRPP